MDIMDLINLESTPFIGMFNNSYFITRPIPFQNKKNFKKSLDYDRRIIFYFDLLFWSENKETSISQFN